MLHQILALYVLMLNPDTYKHLRVGPVLLGVANSQVLALDHKDVELAQLRYIADGELDGPLDVHTTKVPAVDAHHTASDLPFTGVMQRF